MFSADHSAFVEALLDDLSENITAHRKGGDFTNVCWSGVILLIAQPMRVSEEGILIEFHEFRILVHLCDEGHDEKLVVQLQRGICVPSYRELEMPDQSVLEVFIAVLRHMLSLLCECGEV